MKINKFVIFVTIILLHSSNATPVQFLSGGLSGIFNNTVTNCKNDPVGSDLDLLLTKLYAGFNYTSPPSVSTAYSISYSKLIDLYNNYNGLLSSFPKYCDTDYSNNDTIKALKASADNAVGNINFWVCSWTLGLCDILSVSVNLTSDDFQNGNTIGNMIKAGLKI